MTKVFLWNSLIVAWLGLELGCVLAAPNPTAEPVGRPPTTDDKPDVKEPKKDGPISSHPTPGDTPKAKDEPKKDGAKKVPAAPEDIRQVLGKAGFDATIDWSYHLLPYARFGSKEIADRFARGDKFDKIEITKASRDHRDGLRKRTFLVKGLKFLPIVRDDIETRGLVGNLDLPMRVRGGLPFHADALSFAGILAAMHPADLDARQNWFLAKTGKLLPCTPAEAAAVKRNDGVLYHPESATTTLLLIFTGTLDALKGIARNATGFAVEIEFTDLAYERPAAWGYYRRDAYHEADWDCEKLREDFLLDGNNPQPAYFATAIGKDDVKVPEIVQARITVLRVSDKAGTVVGGYRIDR